jgi:hypothetical protein
LCAIMAAISSIWMLIPAGIVLGNGVIFSYYALTGNWRHWTFLWPLEPLLIGGTLWLTLRLAKRGERSGRSARRLAHLLGLAAVSWSILIGLLSILVTLLQPV